MKTVVIANSLDQIKRTPELDAVPLSVLNLASSHGSNEIVKYIRKNPDVTEISKPDYLRKEGDRLKDTYIELMSSLNRNNACLMWWAMQFTDKYPVVSKLPVNIINFLMTAEVVRQQSGTVLVIVEDSRLAAQIQQWATGEQVRVICQIKARWSLRKFLQRYALAGLIRALLISLYLWMLSFKHGFTVGINNPKLLIVSPTRLTNITGVTGYRDAFFGPLLDTLRDPPRDSVVVAIPLDNRIKQINKLKELDFKLPVIPMDSQVSLSDLIACTWRCIKARVTDPKPKGPFTADELDLEYLILQEYQDALCSGNLYMDLRMYYWAKRVGQTMEIERLIYPFENLSWEKMLVMGFREVSPDTRLTGYQHASISQAHTNFLFGSNEAGITPLPNVICTTGEIIQNRLIQTGNYPNGIFRATCALRQELTADRHISRKTPLTNVLVALARDLEEHASTMSFLEAALGKQDRYILRVRPHPDFSLPAAIKLSGLSRHDFFSESVSTLVEDLHWSDVVLYSSSTVGMEALAHGIPAVHIDLGDFLSTDPMSDLEDLKRTVSHPEELIDILDELSIMPDDIYHKLQARAQRYVSNYLTPVTPKGLCDLLSS